MELSYRVLDMCRRHTDEEVRLINTCFDYWSKVFGEDLASRGATLNKSDFHRARILAVLFYNEEVVGFHLYSVFDLRETPSLNHPYVIAIPEELKISMGRSAPSIMAMEYLTVFPQYRSLEIEGIKPAELIVRLGLRVLAEELKLDVAIGIARVDRKVNSMGLNMGFEEYSIIEKFNNKCAIVYFDRHRHKLLGGPKVADLVEGVWSKRNQVYQETKKAA